MKIPCMKSLASSGIAFGDGSEAARITECPAEVSHVESSGLNASRDVYYRRGIALKQSYFPLSCALFLTVERFMGTTGAG